MSTVRTRRDDDPSAFGTLLRRFRLAAGLSQEALAERAGLSVDAIGMLERRVRRAPYVKTVERLAEALGLRRADGEKLIASVDRRRTRRRKPKPRRAASAPLPSPLTRLIGRTEALALARPLLAERTRLLTVTGTPGVGKTRFALALAHDLESAFDGGAAFVGLAAIREAHHVATAILSGLERDDDAAATLDALCALVGDRRVLIVADNLEQIAGCGAVLCEFLERCGNAVVVATSREALGVRGEQEFALQPLPTDDAYSLLVDRARAVCPDLDLRASDDALRAICARLDGLPLAIELAAGRLRHESAEMLLERLEAPLDALVAGARDLPERQRTLRDAIAWSYDLLSESERRLLWAGALFVAGGPVEAPGEVLVAAGSQPSGEALALMQSLAGKHMIALHNGSPRELRFEMLETIREYACERLAESNAGDAYRRAFARHHAAIVRREAIPPHGAARVEWFDRIARSYENFRAALRWAVVNDRSLGLQIAVDLGLFWQSAGYYAEPLRWLEPLAEPLDQTMAREEPRLGWQVLNALGLARYFAGDGAGACLLFERTTAIARAWDDRPLVARSLNNLGIALTAAGDWQRARSVLEEARQLKERYDDSWSIATTLGNLGVALRLCGEHDAALGVHGRARDLFRSIGDVWGDAGELNFIADVHRDRGDYREAARCYGASLDANELAIKPAAADSFEGLLPIAAAANHARRVAVLAGAVDAIRRETGRATSAFDDARRASVSASARASIGDEAFERAWEEAVSLPLREAIEVARMIARDLGGGAAISSGR